MAAAQAPVALAFCPSCGCFLGDFGGQAEQAAHVSSCTQLLPEASSEGGTTREEEGAVQQLGGGGTGVSSSEDGNQSEAEEDGLGPEAEGADPTSEKAAGVTDEMPAPEAAGAALGPPITDWLADRGLGKYADLFERAGADVALLPYLGDEELRQLGVATLGARKMILLAAAELAPQETAARGGGHAPSAAAACEEGAEAAAAAERLASHGQAGTSSAGAGVGSWRALLGSASAALAGSITTYFKPVGGGKRAAQEQQQQVPQGSILNFLKPENGATFKLAAPGAAAAAAGGGRGQGRSGPKPQPGPWVHREAVAGSGGGGGGGGRRWGPRAAAVQPLRVWQLVPGTQFVVDRFCNLAPSLPQHRHWFLTHFHADHYKGLTSKFDRGLIYCTPITAALVRQQLKVPADRLRPHALNAPFTVDGVRVTFLDANHCPGAAMVLFEPPGRRPVLHTGDCRLVPRMREEAALAAVRGRVDLTLDTTYCAPEYAFPAQSEVLQFSIDAVKAEAFNPKTLFLFGSYTIGKERLFLEAARVLQRKIYVSATKRKVLDCLDLPPEYASLLTCDDKETNLHAVPLWMVSQKHMAKTLKFYRGRFNSVVGFQPTGWTHEKAAGSTRARGRRRQKGTLITYQARRTCALEGWECERVPYSEHSSFTELREFVQWLQPRSIVPSVNSDGGGPKAQHMVTLLLGSG
eukprot:scaffold12.g8123.t1